MSITWACPEWRDEGGACNLYTLETAPLPEEWRKAEVLALPHFLEISVCSCLRVRDQRLDFFPRNLGLELEMRV